jgi:hypothetical protein
VTREQKMAEQPKETSRETAAAERLSRKEAAATEGAKAMADYQAASDGKRKNLARLREMRLAREATEKEAQINAARKAKAAASRAASRKKKAISVSKLNASNDG